MNKQLVIFFCMVWLGNIPCSSATTQALTFTTLLDGVHLQLSQRILTKAYSRLGITFTVRQQPSKRALVMANAGKSDGELRRLDSLDGKYPNLIKVPTSIGQLELRAFSLKKLDLAAHHLDLKKYSVAIINGARASTSLTKDLASVKKVRSYRNLFQMLLAQRVEVVIAEKHVGLNELMLLKEDQAIFISRPLLLKPLHHYLHKKHASLVARLDAVLRAMTEDGEIEAITKRFYHELNLENVKLSH